MELWKILLLFFSALAGGLSIFLFKQQKADLLKLILSFSGAYLFSITVLHLIPEVYKGPSHELVGVFILLGFLLQVFLEQFSEGVEHGHLHKHHEESFFPYGIMISLCLHAFLEGMPLVKEQNHELIFGISLHHIPAAFALASILFQNHSPKSQIIICLVIFASMAPLGFYFSERLSLAMSSGMEVYFNHIMGVVIGIFLHISTTILFESSAGHKINQKKMTAVLLGIGIALAGYFSSH